MRHIKNKQVMRREILEEEKKKRKIKGSKEYKVRASYKDNVREEVLEKKSLIIESY